MSQVPYIRDEKDGCRLEVLVRPKASRTAVVGIHDGRLKIALTAPPVDGEANEALVRFLSTLTGRARSDISIARGHTGRQKSVLLNGLDAAELTRLLAPHLAEHT